MKKWHLIIKRKGLPGKNRTALIEFEAATIEDAFEEADWQASGHRISRYSSPQPWVPDEGYNGLAKQNRGHGLILKLREA